MVGNIGEIVKQAITGWMPGVMYWMGIILFSLMVLGIGYFIYHILSYKLKITIFVRGGSGSKDDEDHSIRAIIGDRGKFIAKKGVEKLQLLFKRTMIEPVQMKYVYPGNRIFLYQVGIKEFIPVKFSCSNPEAYFSPLPFSIRRWQNLEMQEANKAYQNMSFAQKYGSMIMMLSTVLILSILVGWVFYQSYAVVAGGLNEAAGSAGRLAESLKEFGAQQIGGK